MEKQNNWLPFEGVVKRKYDDSVTLKSTDGSDGVVSVDINDFKMIDGVPHTKTGCHIDLLSVPKIKI